jgi:hypothetical protein
VDFLTLIFAEKAKKQDERKKKDKKFKSIKSSCGLGQHSKTAPHTHGRS